MKALVTGATGGIGGALIEKLIVNNWEVIALGRNKLLLNQLEEKYQGKLLGYSIDIGDEQELRIFFNFLEAEKIEIDMLINGAGIGEIGYFEDNSYEIIKKMIDINTRALTIFSRYFYEKMKIKGKGWIVNISSTAGFQKGSPLMSVYYATKSYVNSLTYGLYEEGKDKGIRVILLAPGPTKTNFKGMEKELSKFEKFYVTTPEEVVETFWSGYEKNKFLLIPGKINKILYIVDKLIPWSYKLKSLKKIQLKKLKK